MSAGAIARHKPPSGRNVPVVNDEVTGHSGHSVEANPEGPVSYSSPDTGPAGPDPCDERFRVLVDHSPDAICVHEAGLVVYVNPAAVRWIGAESADQLVGHPITDFVHSDSVPAMLSRIAALRNEGDASDPSEAALLRFDGGTLDVDIGGTGPGSLEGDRG